MNTEVINGQVDEIRVLSWNINGLGNKMADPDILAFIRAYDIIFLTETMKSNDYTLLLSGYQFHHVSRTFKHKNASRAFGGIGILVANKFEKHTRIDSTYDHLVTLMTSRGMRVAWFSRVLSGMVPYNYRILSEKH